MPRLKLEQALFITVITYAKEPCIWKFILFTTFKLLHMPRKLAFGNHSVYNVE
jgi:hypothetical protein